MNCLYSLAFLSFLLQTSFSIPESFPWLSPSHETLPVVVTLANIVNIYYFFPPPTHLIPYTACAGMGSKVCITLSMEMILLLLKLWYYVNEIWYQKNWLLQDSNQPQMNQPHSLTHNWCHSTDIQCLSLVPKPLPVFPCYSVMQKNGRLTNREWPGDEATNVCQFNYINLYTRGACMGYAMCSHYLFLSFQLLFLSPYLLCFLFLEVLKHFT